jgi:hypothetical protein
MFDPARHAILKSVQRVREGVDPHRHAPFARHTLRIPERDFYALLKLYPHLTAKDADTRQAEWDRFERSAFAEPYRVGKITRGIVRNGIVTP